MDLFIIGDVHGCFHTLSKLLEFWDPERQQLIFVGDLIDRGSYSPEVVALVRKLEKEYQAIVLMGNHEYRAYKSIQNDEQTWFGDMGKQVIQQYKDTSSIKQLKSDTAWFKQLALFYENEHVFVSHAGHTGHKNYLKKKDYENSLLWTRKKLKNLGKLQIHGHTPHKNQVVYNLKSHSLNIDSACAYGGSLSACVFNLGTGSYKIVKESVLKKDIV